MFGKNHLAAGELRGTHSHREHAWIYMHAHTHPCMPTIQIVPQVLIDFASVPGVESDAWRKLASHILSDHIQQCGHWYILNAAHLLKESSAVNESREDWKWHSINRTCQTIKQCKQHRWATDESGCRKPFNKAKPRSLKAGCICPSFHLWRFLTATEI